jgi:hypothetical protein
LLKRLAPLDGARNALSDRITIADIGLISLTSKNGKAFDMQEALLDMTSGICAPFEIGALGVLFEPSSTVETNLVSSDEVLIRKLISVLDRQLLAALECRSVAEFNDVRSKVWPRYIRALRALSDTLSNLESDEEMEIRSATVIKLATSDLEKQRGARFKDKLVDQALFTLWTLSKARMLVQQICAAPRPKDKKADTSLNSDYHTNALWAQFHMDCVFAAIKFRRSVSEDIQTELCEGLRAVVNAYVILKEALSLRVPRSESTSIANLPWDEEDERLLASSMRDINATINASNC